MGRFSDRIMSGNKVSLKVKPEELLEIYYWSVGEILSAMGRIHKKP